ncbi:hydantoinase B/oxoprolinase family protein [Mesorhizobium sp. WSM3882]|uniref:hydantoinase B/oxoprolinase family protein n=1 Tax=Mesorhizobium sp. WSM3882 TaxID=2029407 RepID=UPI000BAE8DCA|nr:hydantoinase B/oxoprolinase family protein [Mesorhizobium sp. WSM3882]PBB28979.1 methylhydantoinase [Mesorhizobium sp. WSM3882]
MNETLPILNPIEIEILFNSLRSIADEMFVALKRSAYSANIKERQDHSTVIADLDGRLVVQAEASLPIHIASMTGLLRGVIAKFGSDIAPGDIFVGNDPHVAGGTHLPDINMAMPVFHDGQLVCFVCNIAHHADVGGIAAGSMAGGMSEIYQEGLRIPVLRLVSGYRLQEELLALVLLNVRVPDERRGDYFAQIASCRLGERRVLSLLETFKLNTLKAVFADLIDRTHERMKRHISALPDGVYGFSDRMDDDGLGNDDIPITVRIEKSGSDILFDFTGTSHQVRGNINMTLNATHAAICYCLKALLDPDAPNNDGLLRIPRFTAPEGSLVNSKFPASVAGRAHTCQRVIDVILGAFAQALPDKVVAAANGANTTAVFSGVDPRSGKNYVYLETLGGGFGGRATQDGTDGVQVHITNTSNLPVEAIETEYPLLVESYELVQDSGGAGRHRGGMAIRRVIRPVGHSCVFSGMGERFRNQPWGIFGGEPGRTGQFLLRTSDGEIRLPNKPLGLQVQEGQAVVVETPGAGGYGPPAERSSEDLSRDRAEGRFSLDFLSRNYGYIEGDHS